MRYSILKTFSLPNKVLKKFPFFNNFYVTLLLGCYLHDKYFKTFVYICFHILTFSCKLLAQNMTSFKKSPDTIARLWTVITIHPV